MTSVNGNIVKYIVGILLGIFLTGTVGWTFITVRDFQGDYLTKVATLSILKKQNSDMCQKIDKLESRMISRDKDTMERIVRIEDLLLALLVISDEDTE